MRPQFSILAILLVTAYVAVFAAAVSDLESSWIVIATFALPITFLVACGYAIFGRHGRRAFAIGLIVGCLLYYGLMVVWPVRLIRPPHAWLVVLIWGDIDRNIFGGLFCFAQLTLASGMLGGAIALWLYRCREAAGLQRGTEESLRRE